MNKMIKRNKLIFLTLSLGLSVNAWAEIEATQLPSQATKVESGAMAIQAKATSIRVDKKNPYIMIEKVAKLTFDRFSNEHSSIRQDPNLLKSIVKEELMPYIDYRYSAYKVIGNNFKRTSKEDRAKFVPVFRDYLVTSYAQVFTLYNKQKVEFEPEKKIGVKTKILAVSTRVIEPGRDDINISFKVRKNSKTKDWKAFDMVAEGVSLLDSKQAELGSLIRQKGLPYVTELLKEKSKRSIVFKSS